MDDATRLVTAYVTHYNEVRLHSAIGYVAPRVRLENRHLEVFAERDRKLATARELRQQKRQAQAGAAGQRSFASSTTPTMPSLDFAAVRAAVTMQGHVVGQQGLEPVEVARLRGRHEHAGEVVVLLA